MVKIEPEAEEFDEENGSCILRFSVERAIENKKSKTPIGDDDIPIDLLKRP